MHALKRFEIVQDFSWLLAQQTALAADLAAHRMQKR
jgi:hypothetical protein